MPFFSQPLTRRRDASAAPVVLIVSAGFALATLDLFVVNVALPKIAQITQGDLPSCNAAP